MNGGINTFQYVKGNPLTLRDPFGLQSCGINLAELVENAIAGTMGPNGQQRRSGGGNCKKTVQNDLINSGGPTLPPIGLGNTPTPENLGPTLVNSGCYVVVTDPANYTPQPGDIEITAGNGTGHISIYDGTSWDADIATRNPVPSSGGAYAGATATIYRYVGGS